MINTASFVRLRIRNCSVTMPKRQKTPAKVISRPVAPPKKIEDEYALLDDHDNDRKTIREWLIRKARETAKSKGFCLKLAETVYQEASGSYNTLPKTKITL